MGKAIVLRARCPDWRLPLLVTQAWGKCFSINLNFCICKLGLLHRTLLQISGNCLWFILWFPEGELPECSRMHTLSFPTFTQASSGMEEQLSLLVIAWMELKQLCTGSWTSSIKKGLLYSPWTQGESVGSFHDTHVSEWGRRKLIESPCGAHSSTQ